MANENDAKRDMKLTANAGWRCVGGRFWRCLLPLGLAGQACAGAIEGRPGSSGTGFAQPQYGKPGLSRPAQAIQPGRGQHG
nr:hypothetical protein pPsy0462a_00070 [Pseudomonas syringae]